MMRDYSCCGGDCGNSSGGLNRRDFMKTAAATAAGAAMLHGVPAAAVSDEAMAKWNAQLFDRGARRIYRGEQLEHIGFPLGGFGGGQVYLKGDGRLGPWQNVNNFYRQAEVAGGHFGIWTRDASVKTEARILQEGDYGGARGVTAVEFSSEYPFAWLDYLDGQLPVDVSLEAYSPFIPLNARDSALPAAIFRFKVRNKTDKAVDAALFAAAPNLVAWDGYTPIDGVQFRDFGGNVNRFEKHDGRAELNMGIETGSGGGFNSSVPVYLNDDVISHQIRYFHNIDLHFDWTLPLGGAGEDAVYWIGKVNDDTSPERVLDAIQRGREGATVIVSGGEDNLLSWIDGARKAERGEFEIFEDWESGNYSAWTVEGDAFGPEPARGTLPNQNRVSGYRGKRLVNTYFDGDDTLGKAVSKPFAISHDYIHVLVGGGSNREKTAIRLLVDANVVASATGHNAERVRPVAWDVKAYRGKKATLEIVDDAMGSWGHVLVDDIVFSDAPQMPMLDNEQLAALDDALPFTFEDANWDAEKGWQLGGLALKDGAARMSGMPGFAVRAPLGNGRIIFLGGDPTTWLAGYERKNMLGNLLADAAGANYEPIHALNPDWPAYGSMSLAALGDTAADAQAFPHWDDFQALWRDFSANGGFVNTSSSEPSPADRTWNGALSVPVHLDAHEEKEVRFVLAWHFPNRVHTNRYGWGPGTYRQGPKLGNQYNNWFDNASDVIAYVHENGDRLEKESRTFQETFFDSTLPWYFLDAISANLAIIRSPIYIWLENGFVGGFEGADSCCPMNCTHVYNYVMSTAFLFPELERKVRETDLLIQMHPTEHYIPHRTKLPLDAERLGFEIGGPHHPALDGEFGTLLKTYREFRLCGDKDWLGKVWPNAKIHLQYLVKTHVDGTGIIRGEQPNTYDVHTYGSNTFIGTLFLAALRAMEEMARVMGDDTFAGECRSRFEKGRETYDRVCWDGEYYMNVYDAPDGAPEIYNRMNCWGPGCHGDQLLGQFWADLLDLGYMLPAERTKEAIKAVHRHCWLPDLSNHEHSQRVFAEGNEKGMLNCAWPKGGRPQRPVLYCDEVWTGIEYHVASTLIREGHVAEGLQIVMGARERYTGDNRNPFAELECGYHYSRALSCYGLLMAAGGMAVDAWGRSITLAPRFMPHNYRGFFSTGTGWGRVARLESEDTTHCYFRVDYGEVTLNEVRVSGSGAWSASVNGMRVASTVTEENGLSVIRFGEPLVLEGSDMLAVKIG